MIVIPGWSISTSSISLVDISYTGTLGVSFLLWQRETLHQAAMVDKQTLLSGEGELNSSALENIPFSADESVSVACALSAHGLSQATFLNTLLGTSLAPTDQQGIEVAFVSPDDSAALAEPGRALVVLNVEEFDGRNSRTRSEQREKAANLALALSNVTFFALRMVDLARPEASGLTALRSSLGELLRLQSEEIIPLSPGKRLFVVVVRGYEADVLPREELIAGLMRELQSVYDDAAKPPRAPTRIIELFDFEFVTLADHVLCADEFSDQMAALSRRLLDPASDDYMFEGGAYARARGSEARSLDNVTIAAWAELAEEEIRGDLPPDKELTSTFDCDNVMRSVYEKYQRSVRVWRRETDGGGVIENFGSHAAALIAETISIFESDAAVHRGSRAFRRKREELRSLIDADLYLLFMSQISRLREVTYRIFKDALDGVDADDDALDKKVNSALKDCQRAFRKDAEGLRPRNMSWRFDNDIKELSTQMREDANECIQLARLAEYQENGGRRRRRRAPRQSVPGKPRQPISIGVHYLNPSPFGIKDSRYEKLNVDDSVAYNPPPRNTKAIVGLPAGNGNGAGSAGGLSIPLMPERGQAWNNFG